MIFNSCRIPVTAPLTPADFFEFVLRNFYPQEWREVEKSLETSSLDFSTLEFRTRFPDAERKIIHIAVPRQQEVTAAV